MWPLTGDNTSETAELPPLAFSFANKGLRVLLRERGLLKPDGSMDHEALEAALAGRDSKGMKSMTPSVGAFLANRAYYLLGNAKPLNDSNDEWREERKRWEDDFHAMTGE